MSRGGDCFAGYRLIRRLSVGFFAETYLARPPASGAPGGDRPARVILKRALPTVAEDPLLRSVFEREISFARVLSHRCLPERLDDGVRHTLPYLVFARAPGQSLAGVRDRLAAQGRGWPAARVAWVGRELSDALTYLHEFRGPQAPRGLLHQDVAASNVIVSPDGRVTLVDLGALVRRGRGDEASAFRQTTAAYAAPEQLDGGRLSRATDTYALGLLLLELLLGRRVRSAAEPPRDGAAALRQDAAAFARLARERRSPLQALLGQLLRRTRGAARWKTARIRAAFGRLPCGAAWAKQGLPRETERLDRDREPASPGSGDCPRRRGRS